MERKPKTKQAETQVSFPHLYHWILPLIPFSCVFPLSGVAGSEDPVFLRGTSGEAPPEDSDVWLC